MLYDLKKMNIDVMISTCNIIGDYDKFNNNLLRFIRSNHNREDIWNLHKVCVGIFSSSNTNAKNFFRNNRNVIKTIIHKCTIMDYITTNYDLKGNIYKNSCLDTFTEYLKKHRDKINIISANLQKIKSLGFEEVFFDEKIDFKRESYSLSFNFKNNFEFEYLDNLRLLSKKDDIIKYKTDNSDYKMILQRDYLKGNISVHNSKIILNSLIFDLDRLPDKVSRETTFDYIASLKEKNSLSTIINLNTYINELYIKFSSNQNKENTNNKDELKKMLNQMRNNVSTKTGDSNNDQKSKSLIKKI